MITLLMAAASLAGPPNSQIVPADAGEGQAIIVKGRRSSRDWKMPKLSYAESPSCPAFIETEIPGFGVMRVRSRCSSDPKEWRLYQY